MRQRSSVLISFAMLLGMSSAAVAGPWAEVGDKQARSDIEVLAAAGVLDNVTMQWPIPWTGVLARLQDNDGFAELPDDLREAADRLLAQGGMELSPYLAHAAFSFDASNKSATVRGFDALGRSKAEGSVAYEYVGKSLALHLNVGTKANNSKDRQALVFDGSYFAQRIDGVLLYAGYRSHWWGPGWISALSQSNNARPIPQIGFSRVSTHQSESVLLNWLGPWQLEGFVGVLDGPRVARNTAFIGLRFAFNPAPGLEIGLSRITEMCGSGHKCSPLVDYFTFSNDNSKVNRTNEQGSVDIRYTGMAFSRPFAVYAQLMNEDSNPIVNSTTSRLFGGSVWLPIAGLSSRFTLEYANSIPTKNVWGGGIQHGAAYNNYDYVDGMRYRGRTLGFSLDSDSILYSAQASVIDAGRRTYSLTYHRALVSTRFNGSGNVVTPTPVRFDSVEGRFAIPVQWGDYGGRIETALRWQSDQPRPDRGNLFAAEIALRFGL